MHHNVDGYEFLKLRKMNFTEYWNTNKEFYEKLGVSESLARKIWHDCCDATIAKITEHYIDKL